MIDEDEFRIKHLYETSQLLTSNNRTHLVVKNHLLSKCVSESLEGYKLPKLQFGTSERCQTCYIPWKDNQYSFKIMKQKKLKKRSRRKLKMIALNRNGLREDKEIEKAQQKLATDVLSIKCLFCNNITKHMKPKFPNSEVCASKAEGNKLNPANTFEKTPHKSNPNQILKKKLISSMNNVNSSPSTPAKSATPTLSSSALKKKKKRDKFAGLNKMACLASTPKSESPLMLLMKRTR